MTESVIALFLSWFSLLKHFDSIILPCLPVKSVSLDNGSEFSEFRKLEEHLHTLVYFAEPHKPWQRGTNENTNDIMRFFFPKGFDFRTVTDEDIQFVEDLINNRPRKCLGWKTPTEILEESVALAWQSAVAFAKQMTEGVSFLRQDTPPVTACAVPAPSVREPRDATEKEKDIWKQLGSDGSAACGGRSDLSEWPRSTDAKERCRRRQMSGTATGIVRRVEEYGIIGQTSKKPHKHWDFHCFLSKKFSWESAIFDLKCEGKAAFHCFGQLKLNIQTVTKPNAFWYASGFSYKEIFKKTIAFSAVICYICTSANCTGANYCLFLTI